MVTSLSDVESVEKVEFRNSPKITELPYSKFMRSFLFSVHSDFLFGLD